MNIVLFEPEIPHNTGSIGRICACTGSRLHLIRPLGFSTDEKHLRRTGLDYWHTLDITYHDSFHDFMLYKNQETPEAVIWMTSTKAKYCYSDVKISLNDYIMFGKESAGTPETILLSNLEHCIRIPMAPDTRSLNLAVSAGIVLYEGLRQNGFPGLVEKGKFGGLV